MARTARTGTDSTDRMTNICGHVVIASAASVRPMQHAGGLCRKPHVSTSLDQYQFYKFLRGLSSRPERPAAHPRGPLRPPASLEPRSPACHALLRPAAPTSHVGSTCPTSQSLDRTLNKLALRHLPPSSSRRGSSCRPAAVQVRST